MGINFDRYELISETNAVEIETIVERLIETAPSLGKSVIASDVLTLDEQEMVKLVKYSVPQLSIFLMPSTERRKKFLENYSATIEVYPAAHFAYQAEMASRYRQLLKTHMQIKHEYFRLLQENGLINRSIDIQRLAVEIVHAEHEQIVKSGGGEIRLYPDATEFLVNFLTGSNSSLKPTGRNPYVIIYTALDHERNIVRYLKEQSINYEIRNLATKGQYYHLEAVGLSGGLFPPFDPEGGLKLPVMVVERKGRITVIKGRNISELETALGKGSLLRRIFG